MYRVLIADKNPDLRAFFKALLQAQYPTLEVFEASSGDEAVGSAITDQPDLIFMDDALPAMTSTTAARLLKMKPQTRHIPLIELKEGTLAEPSIDQAQDGLFDRVIPKPLELAAWMVVIQGLTREFLAGLS